MKLKYCLADTDSGAWGDDPEDGCGVPVLRSTEIDLDGNLNPKDPAHRSLSEREISRTRLARGDLLVVRSSGSDVHLGKTGYVGDGSAGASFSNFLQRLRLAPTHNSRFAWYFMNSTYAKQQIRKLSSTTTGLQNLSAALIGELEIPSPPLEEQRRIADFLDAETVRIDQLAHARTRHVNLVEERWESTIYRELSENRAEMVELRRLGVAVTTGPFGTVFNASEYEDGGIPMVNPLHIKNGEITPDRHHSVSLATAARLSRHLLRSGDLVVGRKGDLGRAALVSDHQDGWVCGSDCIAVHPSSRLRPTFLAYVLRSQYVRTQLLARSLAATMPSLSEGNLLSLRIPRLDVQSQEAVTLRLDDAHDWFVRAVAAMRSQLDLLAERRQALITAAVTGHFDVTTASGRNVTDGVTA